MELVSKENKEKIEKEKEKEEKNKKEEDFRKKLEKNKMKVMTTFKNVKNSYSESIIPKIKHHKRFVNNSFKILLGEEKDEQNKNNFMKIKKIKILQSSKSAFDISHISKNAKKLSRTINFHVNKIKKSHEELTALNAVYLDNILFPERNTVNSRNNKIINYNNDSNSQVDKNYLEAIKKKDLRNNFDFISKNYHHQLNLAFLKYNPLIYSNNLKMLLQVSPSVREDVSKTKLEIEGDIKAMKDKHRKAKIFQKIKTTKNARSRSIDYFEPNLFKIPEIQKNINSTKNSNNLETGIVQKKKFSLLPNIGGDKSPGNRRDFIIKNGKIEKIKKRESKKNLNIFDFQNNDDNILLNISKEIGKYIDNDNIGKKIDNHIEDFKKYKYMSLFQNNEDNKNSSFKPQDYYFLQKKKINSLFGDLYIKRLKEKILEEERNLGNKLRIDRNDYFNKMTFDMKSSLNEFDDNMLKNEIKLE